LFKQSKLNYASLSDNMSTLEVLENTLKKTEWKVSRECTPMAIATFPQKFDSHTIWLEMTIIL
jgi:hypothetical protein